MRATGGAIRGELQHIEQRSPEDMAVLMTPLLRALEAVCDGRAPHLEHAQTLAIANSLAQAAAQAGDADAAVAIASIAAELRPETVSDGITEPQAPQGAAEPKPGERTDAAPAPATADAASPLAARPTQPVGVPTPAGSEGPDAATPPRRSDAPSGRYRDLLDREVVITDGKGSRHAGTLTGVGKHGVTLQRAVERFGESIPGATLLLVR